MDSDSASTSTSACVSPPPVKKICKNEFKNEWLLDPEFTTWLEKCENIQKANCKICQKVITANRSSLLQHKNTERHIQNEGGTKVPKEEDSDGERASKDLAERVKRAEAILCQHILKHNRNFRTFNHYIEMLRRCFPDSEVVQNLNPQLFNSQMYKTQEMIPEHLKGIILPNAMDTETDTDTD
ncbi:uncharacterized protein LOC117224054 [Megalopta genalis]|uniref:uncharacterized protein LOC117224054 n=1 Tax=Megalopta genalis TaxID=115081 RepID=UPI003FD2C354